jgi:hypothetical protein
MLNYYENLDLFGCFGDQGSLEVAHIPFLVLFTILIASSGIRAKVDCFLQQSLIHIITMPFWNEEERARLDKMRSEFLAYKEEASKRMEEIRKRIESFSPPRTSLASQAPPLTPTPPAATITKKRKKRVVEVTKIHQQRHSTKPPSIGRKSAHLSRKFRRHQTQPSKRAVINSRRASMPLEVTRVHCGAREVKKRVKGTLAAKFCNTGQTCVCANRVRVQEVIYEKSIKACSKAVQNLQVGDGFTMGVVQGPLINEAVVKTVEGQGLIFAKPEFFLGDKEDVRGEG